MSDTKIHILYRFRDTPWGGGNQFLKALRQYFVERGVYEEDPYKAEAILFNSNWESLYKLLAELVMIKRKTNPAVINRVDGPVYLIRNQHYLLVDKVIVDFDHNFCHGAVLQSQWVYERMRAIGYQRHQNYVIIPNSIDHRVFHRSGVRRDVANGKIKLLAASWSSSPNKGFDIYQFLDERLDFKRYEMTFVGNSPVRFANIKHIPPCSSIELAEKLRGSDVFITASKNDPCSNALIEALHCGLPAVVLNSGGHPEIVKNGGVVFNGQEDVIHAIDKVANELSYYRNKIDVATMDEVGQQYYTLLDRLSRTVKQNGTEARKFNQLNYIRLRALILTHLVILGARVAFKRLRSRHI